MSFHRGQRTVAWTSFAIMAAMALYPPWLWGGGEGALAEVRVRAGHGFLWSPPQAPRQWGLQPLVWWWYLQRQMLVVGVGMLLLLFLGEARQRTAAGAPRKVWAGPLPDGCEVR